MVANLDISGITGNLLQIGAEVSGPQIKNASGNIQIRNAGDTDHSLLVARLAPPASSGSAGTAPIVLTSGTALGTAEDGAFEYCSSHLYFTIGSTKYQLDQQAVSGTFVRISASDTITAQHSFSPGSDSAPFTLGEHAQGQLVTGLNADQLDGHDASYFQTSDATLTALAGLSTSANKLILVTGTDTFSVGQLTDTYVDSLSQSKTHGSADTDTATTALHHTLGTGANQAAAGNHDHSGTYQPVDATLTALAGLSTSADKLILVTGSDTFSVGALTDTYVASANKDGTASTASMRTLGTGSQQAAAGNHSHAIVVTFSYTDIGTPKSSTATVPSEAVVLRTVVIVSSAFTGGSSPTCLVEVDGSSTDTTISSTSQSDLTVAGQYTTTDLVDVPSSQGGAVRVTLGGTASAGSGKVLVEYMLPAT